MWKSVSHSCMGVSVWMCLCEYVCPICVHLSVWINVFYLCACVCVNTVCASYLCTYSMSMRVCVSRWVCLSYLCVCVSLHLSIPSTCNGVSSPSQVPLGPSPPFPGAVWGRVSCGEALCPGWSSGPVSGGPEQDRCVWGQRRRKSGCCRRAAGNQRRERERERARKRERDAKTWWLGAVKNGHFSLVEINCKHTIFWK